METIVCIGFLRNPIRMIPVTVGHQFVKIHDNQNFDVDINIAHTAMDVSMIELSV